MQNYGQYNDWTLSPIKVNFAGWFWQTIISRYDYESNFRNLSNRILDCDKVTLLFNIAFEKTVRGSNVDTRGTGKVKSGKVNYDKKNIW